MRNTAFTKLKNNFIFNFDSPNEIKSNLANKILVKNKEFLKGKKGDRKQTKMKYCLNFNLFSISHNAFFLMWHCF